MYSGISEGDEESTVEQHYKSVHEQCYIYSTIVLLYIQASF